MTIHPSTIFFGYVFGLLLHVVFKMGVWQKHHPDLALRRYLREQLGENITSAVSAFVMFGLWRSGSLMALGDWAIGLAGIDAFSFAEIPIDFWTSVLAGFVMDWVARRIFTLIGNRLPKTPDA